MYTYIYCVIIYRGHFSVENYKKEINQLLFQYLVQLFRLIGVELGGVGSSP